MKINLPIFLSLIRILVIPILVVVFYLPFWWTNIVCAIIFVLASITDAFDGYLARKFKQVTKFGAFIDPIADKLIVSVTMILIADQASSWVITLPILIIISREIIISGLREWMASLGSSDSVAVSVLGKLKTGLQMVAITCLLWGVPITNVTLFEVGLVLIYLAAVLSVWSMGTYLLAAKQSIEESNRR